MRSSNSKVKLFNNFQYYKAKNDTLDLEYEIVDINMFFDNSKEAAVCRLCHSNLQYYLKSL